MADFTGPDTALPFVGQVFPRTNHDLGALITGAAQGAGTVTTADQVNAGSSGLIAVLDITAKTGTIDVTMTVQRKDVASGKYTNLLSTTSKTATGTYTLVVSPHLTAAGNSIAQDFVGEVWRIQVVHGVGTTPATTYTVGACLIP